MKRTRLTRGKPLARGKGLARTRMRVTIDQVRRDAEREVRLAVFARDDHRCMLEGQAHAGPCGGRLTFHHRRKAGAGGAYTEANGATLCVRHNGWVEDEPDEARWHFPYLVVRPGDADWHLLGRRAARLGTGPRPLP